MMDIKLAITIVEIVIAIIFAMALGEYLGYKIGRMRLAVILLGIVLVVIVCFTIYAGIVLA